MRFSSVRKCFVRVMLGGGCSAFGDMIHRADSHGIEPPVLLSRRVNDNEEAI